MAHIDQLISELSPLKRALLANRARKDYRGEWLVMNSEPIAVTSLDFQFSNLTGSRPLSIESGDLLRMIGAVWAKTRKANPARTAVFMASNGPINASLVSQQLGLRGPSFNLHADAFSGLSCLNLALKSLRSGECDYAFVGGLDGGRGKPGSVYGAGFYVLQRYSDALLDEQEIVVCVTDVSLSFDSPAHISSEAKIDAKTETIPFGEYPLAETFFHFSSAALRMRDENSDEEKGILFSEKGHQAEIRFVASFRDEMKSSNEPKRQNRMQIKLKEQSYLLDHIIRGEPIFPGAGFVEMVLVAAQSKWGESLTFIKELTILEPLSMNPKSSFDFNVQWEDESNESASFKLQVGPVLHAVGRCQRLSGVKEISNWNPLEHTHSLEKKNDLYTTLAKRGYDYASQFQVVKNLWLSRDKDEAIAEIKVQDTSGHLCHPSALDGCLQVGLASALSIWSEGLYLPLMVEDFFVLKPLPNHFFCRSRVVSGDAPGSFTVEISAYSADGTPLMSVKEVTFRAAKAKKDYKRFFCEETWIPSSGTSFDPTQSLLVIAHDASDSQAFTSHLSGRGINHQVMLLPPKAAEDIATKIKKFAPLTNKRIVYFLKKAPTPVNSTLVPTAEEICETALKLSQSLLEASEHPLGLTFVSRGVFSWKNSFVSLEQSPLLGFFRTLYFEHPDLMPSLVDLPGAFFGNWDLLLANLSLDEPEVCIREEKAFFRRISPVELPVQKNFSCTADGFYIVSGAMGALGLLMCSWLEEKGAREIIMLGRSAPSAQAEALIKELRGRGVQVETFSCDVSVHDEIFKVAEHARSKKWKIKGVIHAAGVLDDSPISSQSWERFKKALSPKVSGAWNLYQIFKEEELEFLLMFSSQASLWGWPAQANYSAGNAFLDGLARYGQVHSVPCFSVNWGPWGEIGMATSEKVAKFFSRMGFDAIKNSDGLLALESILVSETPQVGVIDVDRAKFSEAGPKSLKKLLSGYRTDFRSDSRSDSSLKKQQIDPPQIAPHQKVSSAASSRMADVEVEIKRIVVKIMEFESDSDIDVHRPLMDMGLDSMMSVELRNHIMSKLSTSLPANLIFKYPTISKIAEYISSQMTEDKSKEAKVVLQERSDLSAPSGLNIKQRTEAIMVNVAGVNDLDAMERIRSMRKAV